MDEKPRSSLSAHELRYIIDHVFLPPKLPQSDDFDAKCQLAMVNATLHALEYCRELVEDGDAGRVDQAIAMVASLKRVHTDHGGLANVNEEKLLKTMADVRMHGGIVPLHIAEQNAGILLSKHGESIHVEMFELLAQNIAVMSTKGRLCRCFPGPALAVNGEIFEQPGLQATIAQTLALMARQPGTAKSEIKKDGRSMAEDRGTACPKIVTELFDGFLRPFSQAANVHRLWKHVREEISYYKALRPWRRSPLWLLLRVSIQLLFSRTGTSESNSLDLYKIFMLIFLTRILRTALQLDVSSDLLDIMRAKVTRRLQKLYPSSNGVGVDFVASVIENTNQVLQLRWSEICDREGRICDLNTLVDLNFAEDTMKALPALDAHIGAMRGRTSSRSSIPFKPAKCLLTVDSQDLPHCRITADKNFVQYNLIAIESWVALHLEQWTESHKSDGRTCSNLARLMEDYYKIASLSYSGNPEALSLMLLTILEIWIACDKSATFCSELLTRYDPEIPHDFTQSLLLPLKCQMQRLSRAEMYLRRRKDQAKHPASFLYSAVGHSNCFAVAYFNQSRLHQDLLKDVERSAGKLRQKRRHEFHRLKKEYATLMQLYSKGACACNEANGDSKTHIRRSIRHLDCKKCRYKDAAAALKVRIHEWPLPRDVLQAQSIIFELQLPPWFGNWRRAAFFLMFDVLKCTYLSSKRPQASIRPARCETLSEFFKPTVPEQRVVLLSSKKPHSKTHRRKIDVSTAREDDILYDNAACFQYYDEFCQVFVAKILTNDKVPEQCTYTLPPRSKSLQQFLVRPASKSNGPSPNVVISSQTQCPDHISLGEYKSLGSIPLGNRLQWRNILLQLSAPTVDLNKVESSLIILQCTYQTGPADNSSILRASHEIVADEFFAGKLWNSLNDSLHRIKENWDSSKTLSLLISLATRLLSLNRNQEIAVKFLDFLTRARAVAMEWTRNLGDQTAQAMTDEQRTKVMAKISEIALICIDSFNVDEECLEAILAEPSQAAILIECCIANMAGSTKTSQTQDPILAILRLRQQRVSYRAFPILSRIIVGLQSPALDDAIKWYWSDYRPASGWRVVSPKADYWLFSRMRPQEGRFGHEIHCNLLTGELLVDGRSLSQLPSNFENDPNYCSLFGGLILEVMPSTSPGMQFSGKRKHFGFDIDLGMSGLFNGSNPSSADLLVQVRQNSNIWELIPSRFFEGSLPFSFVEDYIHWYDMAHDCINFRPRHDPWSTAAGCWKLKRSADTSKWCLVTDTASLISIKSQTAKVVSGFFAQIEDIDRIHLVYNTRSCELDIRLPRLHLDFYILAGEKSIESRQFPEMSVDQNQYLGTLVGLETKILLKHHSDDDRLLLVPRGDIVFGVRDGHVLASIERCSMSNIYAYRVDPVLGRLIAENVHSKLILCYLHALTSFCLPDPLTMYTGTEQSLAILNSAAVKSVPRLDPDSLHLLSQIAALTPDRQYYPPDLRVMQTATWSPKLGFLAQHPRFYKFVKSLFQQVEQNQFFYPDIDGQKIDSIPPEINHPCETLLERDCIRSSTFRGYGFGAEDYTISEDVIYHARDRGQDSVQASNAFLLSHSLYWGHSPVQEALSKDAKVQLWQYLSKNSDKTCGRSEPLSSLQLTYGTIWLRESSKLLSCYWAPLHHTLSRGTTSVDKFRIMMWLSTLAFADDANMLILTILASFACVQTMSQIVPPGPAAFCLSDGVSFCDKTIDTQIRHSLHSEREYATMPKQRLENETKSSYLKRRRQICEQNDNRLVATLVGFCKAQWPSPKIDIPVGRLAIDPDIFSDIKGLSHKIGDLFRSWNNNMLFDRYLKQVIDLLANKPTEKIGMPSASFEEPSRHAERSRGFINHEDAFMYPAPSLKYRKPKSVQDYVSRQSALPRSIDGLRLLVDHLKTVADSEWEIEYVGRLRDSLCSLQDTKGDDITIADNVSLEKVLARHLRYCRSQVDRIYTGLVAALHSKWRRHSPSFFLQQLARGSQIKTDWKHTIIDYALALTDLQRAMRLLKLARNPVELMKELKNSGHTNWDPRDFPEFLLMEVESGILIREVQARIAKEMQQPSTGGNAVMQLNMGEGKSSVIIPMVAAALANGSCMVRVVVAKPQSKQLFQMLLAKFGGLLNRRIYQMPVSRALRLNTAQASIIHQMCRECMSDGGVLLVQPEHILSFKLLRLCSLIDGDAELGRTLEKTQHFFDDSSRDIVDETDEIFSVKLELVYTMGLQLPVELSPDRWICIQQVLDFLQRFVPCVKENFPMSVEVYNFSSGAFPRIRIFGSDAQQRILQLTAEEISAAGLKNFPIDRQPDDVKQAIITYITKLVLTREEKSAVEGSSFWLDDTCKTLLLLRGLFAGGILAFALGQKRWRVNYGLDTAPLPRTKLVIPYRAKDSPAPRSEFSHPDVAIVLTLLTYYYGGLTDSDLFLAFDHLYRSDQAEEEYHLWVREAPELPSEFHQLTGVNLKDEQQCIKQVFPALRYSKGAVDYFLSHLVFSKYMRDFPQKLSASGWDIGKAKAHPTTGFSGTNDSRETLPLMVNNLELAEQAHTNALVLDHLLQPQKNSIALIPSKDDLSQPDAQHFLQIVAVMEPATQVILDVGAQILEYENRRVATEWLKITPEEGGPTAVVYFNNDDELSVIDRQGHVELLQNSSYAMRLDRCHVFLDEAHTRGTDLQLPDYYRAAVTLGANLTKDRLVQACMRMRKLGQGQSVVFCVPSEIKTKILARAKKDDDVKITICDVLNWAISETFDDLRRSMPLWAIHGRRYQTQEALYGHEGACLSKKQAKKFLEPNCASLEDRYRPPVDDDVRTALVKHVQSDSDSITAHCQRFNKSELLAAELQEEQERELCPESEQERQVEKTPSIDPAKHHLHPDLISFVTTGIVVAGSPAYQPAFASLRTTRAAAGFDVSGFPPGLMVTKDFASTVQMPGKAGKGTDLWQRGVQWVLTSSNQEAGRDGRFVNKMIIISPFEAQELLPQIEESATATLHLYGPRLNLDFPALDALDLYSVPAPRLKRHIPRGLVLQLNLFAGQLYFNSFREYTNFCDFLGLAWKQLDRDGDLRLTLDGFVLNRDGVGAGCQGVPSSLSPRCRFRESPVAFLRRFLTSVRCNGAAIDKTHVGAVLEGRTFRSSDFPVSSPHQRTHVGV